MGCVAILVEDEFEDSELFGPRDYLQAAGRDVRIVGPHEGREYRGKRGGIITATAAAHNLKAADLDAIVIPGGHAPDRMRLRHAMVDLVRAMMHAGRPVAAICHGPQVLISADVLRGFTVTCWPSIAIDVKNAGALYVDRPVAIDRHLITSRKPDDVAQFSEAILKALG